MKPFHYKIKMVVHLVITALWAHTLYSNASNDVSYVGFIAFILGLNVGLLFMCAYEIITSEYLEHKQKYVTYLQGRLKETMDELYSK